MSGKQLTALTACPILFRTMDRDSIAHLPRSPGTYALLLGMDARSPVAVGKKGTFEFGSGEYVYVGSARGSGGLRARVLRHQRQSKRLHWHIDYLLAHAELLGVHAVVSHEKLECEWAQALSRLPGAKAVAPGFGSSDCRCLTHLRHFPQGISIMRLQKTLVARPEDALQNLRAAIEASDEEACEAIACALSASPRACSLLKPLLDDARANTRWWGVRALAAASCSESTTTLMALLADPDESVCCEAASALGEMRAEEAVTHLSTLLDNDACLVRTARRLCSGCHRSCSHSGASRSAGVPQAMGAGPRRPCARPDPSGASCSSSLSSFEQPRLPRSHVRRQWTGCHGTAGRDSPVLIQVGGIASTRSVLMHRVSSALGVHASRLQASQNPEGTLCHGQHLILPRIDENRSKSAQPLFNPAHQHGRVRQPTCQDDGINVAPQNRDHSADLLGYLIGHRFVDQLSVGVTSRDSSLDLLSIVGAEMGDQPALAGDSLEHVSV